MALEIVAVQDKWAELLPPKIPLRYAFFRYLGFCIKKLGVGGHTSTGAQKLGLRAAIWFRVSSSKGLILEQCVRSAFSDGTYYVQDLAFQDEGLHTFTVSVEAPTLAPIAPLVLTMSIHHFMRIEDEPMLLKGPYAPLRRLVNPRLCTDPPQALDGSDDGIVRELKTIKHGLRACDAKIHVVNCAHLTTEMY
ncbi:hypothetical protein SPRG_10634 [Saprolegnia parasitica CBS 223.65]|uniref:Uncharacterized protein n=1 Tax=Saprolegnia parasitica (strain CBS 223.65) TaxID=695850 RepID=A0A067C523_SAPPC|nr:hypothetical protein SPRG_10634 [Saprolegnia parasitica CBS 223.65]KDO24205.1 hypothetical protein SPRG_10634 [Saprolegnia parasitica CBS 223.65]|eukprot:XP_012205149.1 hypothetical protein SPRG_10634 [Saprolegnia parasitica CBS 223.65]